MSAAFDAIAIGRHFDFGVYEFTAERIKDYACQFDPQIFHLDEAAAEKSAFGGLCASGWHTASALMRLQVDYFAALANQGETLPRFGMSPGFDNLKWLKPVYAGDRVAYSGTVARQTAVALAARTGDRLDRLHGREPERRAGLRHDRPRLRGGVRARRGSPRRARSL